MKDLVPDLVKINQYRTLAANVEFLEGNACTITEAYGLLKNIQFDDDPCAIKNYIKKRLSSSDLETITNCTNRRDGIVVGASASHSVDHGPIPLSSHTKRL